MYDKIRTAKEKFDDEVYNYIKSLIDRTVKKANMNHLDPVQTFIEIMNNVDKAIKNIKIECGMDTNEQLTEGLMDRIFELTDPYNEEKDKELQNRVEILLDSETLGELFDHYDELIDIVNELKEIGPDPEGLEIKRNIKK